MNDNVGFALIEICKDFEDYFEKEAPKEPMECIEWIKEILEMTKEVLQDYKGSSESK